MGIESSLQNFMRDKEETIKNSSNPAKQRKSFELMFKRAVEDGTIVLLPKGGYTTGKEFNERYKDMVGTPDNPSDFTIAMAEKRSEQLGKTVDPGKSIAGKGMSYFPTGKKKGGKAKAQSKYSKGGGVRATKYKL